MNVTFTVRVTQARCAYALAATCVVALLCALFPSLCKALAIVTLCLSACLCVTGCLLCLLKSDAFRCGVSVEPTRRRRHKVRLITSPEREDDEVKMEDVIQEVKDQVKTQRCPHVETPQPVPVPEPRLYVYLQDGPNKTWTCYHKSPGKQGPDAVARVIPSDPQGSEPADIEHSIKHYQTINPCPPGHGAVCTKVDVRPGRLRLKIRYVPVQPTPTTGA